MLKEIMCVAAGGAAGSALRYTVGRALSGRALNASDAGASAAIAAFPWSTLAVNVAGCLMAGIFYGLVERGNIASPEIRLLLVAGFCGGFTTFSAFMTENLTMLRAGEFLPFVLYVTVSLLLGLAAVWLGWWLLRPS